MICAWAVHLTREAFGSEITCSQEPELLPDISVRQKPTSLCADGNLHNLREGPIKDLDKQVSPRGYTCSWHVIILKQVLGTIGLLLHFRYYQRSDALGCLGNLVTMWPRPCCTDEPVVRNARPEIQEHTD